MDDIYFDFNVKKYPTSINFIEALSSNFIVDSNVTLLVIGLPISSC